MPVYLNQSINQCILGKDLNCTVEIYINIHILFLHDIPTYDNW